MGCFEPSVELNGLLDARRTGTFFLDVQSWAPWTGGYSITLNEVDPETANWSLNLNGLDFEGSSPQSRYDFLIVEGAGHGGVGSSYCWADPTSGVSFAFFSNCRQTELFHNHRMDVLSSLAHAAILPG